MQSQCHTQATYGHFLQIWQHASQTQGQFCPGDSGGWSKTKGVKDKTLGLTVPEDVTLALSMVGVCHGQELQARLSYTWPEPSIN